MNAIAEHVGCHGGVVGVVPRAMKELLDLYNQRKAEGKFKDSSIVMSFLEIYNEKVYDLLSANPNGVHEQKELPVRENQKGQVVVAGLSEVNSSLQHIEQLRDATHEGTDVQSLVDITKLTSLFSHPDRWMCRRWTASVARTTPVLRTEALEALRSMSVPAAVTLWW